MIYTALVLAVFGLCFGSFVNALVWRLKNKRDWVNDRSECVHCHHKLSALDLIPVFSWLLLKGRCRYCKKRISVQYPLVEVAVAAAFVASYLFWPLPFDQWYYIADFGLWLVFVVFLAALFLYDLKWYLLPDKLTFPLIGLGFVDALIRGFLIQNLGPVEFVSGILFGLVPIAGLYGLLYAVSKGAWVGFGDVKLGVFIGLVLGWEGALLTLMIANIIGTLIVIPGLLSGRMSRKSRVPFGPLLIIGFFLSGVFGGRIIDIYMQSLMLN